MTVKKPGKKVRMCVDLTTGLIAALDVHMYPIPLPDELFSMLNGVGFGTIDLKEDSQIPLDDECVVGGHEYTKGTVSI